MRIVKSDSTILYSKPFSSKSVAYYGCVSSEEANKIQNNPAHFKVDYSSITNDFEVNEILQENIKIDNSNNITNSVLENNISNELNEAVSNVITNSEINNINYGIIIGGFALVGFISIILCIVLMRKY